MRFAVGHGDGKNGYCCVMGMSGELTAYSGQVYFPVDAADEDERIIRGHRG